MLGSLIGIWPRNRRTGRASLRRYILSFTNQSSPRLETTRGSRRCDCSPNVARRATTAPEDGGERRHHDGGPSLRDDHRRRSAVSEEWLTFQDEPVIPSGTSSAILGAIRQW